MKKFLILTVAALVALMFTANLEAAAAKPTPFVPHHTLISSISAESITISTYNGSKSYKINKYTTITFQGKTVKTTELKPGMKVSVTAGTDADTAAAITASNPPKDPATPAAKAPAKKK